MSSGGPEDVIETEVVNAAKRAGWIVRKLKWIGRRAGMDRFFLKGGRIVLIEFKAPGEDPEPLQRREIKRFRDAGAEVHVIDSVWKGCKVLGLL